MEIRKERKEKRTKKGERRPIKRERRIGWDKRERKKGTSIKQIGTENGKTARKGREWNENGWGRSDGRKKRRK